MHDVKTSPNHISQVLGQMVKKWELVLPEGVRALEKFNREHENVLIQDSVEKVRLLTIYADLMRLRNFKCSNSGQTIDLSVYKQHLDANSKIASDHKGLLSKKGDV